MAVQNCNKYSGPEPDMFFEEASKMCVPSRNSDRWVFRYEESVVGQLLIIALLMVTFNYILPKIRTGFEKFYSRREFYADPRMEGTGYFGPLKMELKYDSGSAFHHLCAGLLMTAGWMLHGQTLLFRLGVLTEVSIELLDIFDIMIYSRGLWAAANLGAELYLVMLAHHLPGVGLILPLNLWCSCVEIWQQVALAMELVGGFILVNNVLKRIVNDTSLNRLLFDTLSLFGWVWARFWVATPLMVGLVRAGLEIDCKATYGLIVGGSIMTLFNAMITIDYLMKIHSSLSEMVVTRSKEKKL